MKIAEKISKKYEKPLDKVNLEDPMFSKKFDVYSSDQIEARFWVTPAFMERFQNLTTAFGTKKAKCSFYDGDKIMFAISTDKNLFEIGNIETSLLATNNLVYTITKNNEVSSPKELPLKEECLLKEITLTPGETVTYKIVDENNNTLYTGFRYGVCNCVFGVFSSAG